MSGPRTQARPSLFAIAGLTGGLVWVSIQLGPPVVGGEIRPWAALVMVLAAAGCLRLVIRSLELMAGFLDWVSTHQPTGKEGTARWGRYRELRTELSRKNTGPFWGVLADQPQKGLFIDFVSNAYVVGPSGGLVKIHSN